MHISARSLIYMINSNGPSTLLCGIPLSTGYESDSEELIVTLRIYYGGRT